MPYTVRASSRSAHKHQTIVGPRRVLEKFVRMILVDNVQCMAHDNRTIVLTLALVSCCSLIPALDS
jgi:hypothetical protein